MSNAKILLILVASLAVSPAFAAKPSRAAENANAEGNQALHTKRYDRALMSYEKALQLAKKAGDAQYESMAMYGLARTNAQLCHTTLAEKWFRDSISLRESLPDSPKTAFLTQNWIEFARFLLSTGRTEEAVTYFERAVPNLEAMGIEQLDPIGYANLLDDLVAAQVKIGKVDDSKVHAERSAALREKNVGRAADFHPVPYPEGCAPEAK